MKFVLITFCIGFIACSSITLPKKGIGEQIVDTDKILWSPQRELIWNDFKGEMGSINDLKKAETAFVILTDSTYYNNEKTPVYIIGCYFLPRKSWTITNDTLALKHEKLHFDIGELYTRKIRKSFDSLTQNRTKDFKKFQTIFDRLYAQCRDVNKQYDDEAYFDNERQHEWIDRISNQLKELKEFEYLPEE